jgi:ribosome-binding protein aMBF1 (putative translation factor)
MAANHKVGYNVKSGYYCPLCGEELKANLVAKKGVQGTVCYSCYRFHHNRPMLTAREARVQPWNRSAVRVLAKGITVRSAVQG